MGVMTTNARKARKTVENDSYGDFIRRGIRAYGRRVAAGDVEALKSLVQLSTDLDETVAQAVLGLRAFGYSWQEIADRLGTSRQNAQKRWAHRAAEAGLTVIDGDGEGE